MRLCSVCLSFRVRTKKSVAFSATSPVVCLLACLFISFVFFFYKIPTMLSVGLGAFLTFFKFHLPHVTAFLPCCWPPCLNQMFSLPLSFRSSSFFPSSSPSLSSLLSFPYESIIKSLWLKPTEPGWLLHSTCDNQFCQVLSELVLSTWWRRVSVWLDCLSRASGD